MFISGAVSGGYILIVQGDVATSEITFPGTDGEVSNALNAATNSIDYNQRECYYFYANVDRITSLTVKIDVTCYSDISSPLTLLQVYDSSLQGMSEINFNSV